jgi:hypothetical protein
MIKLIFRATTPESASKGPVACFRIDGELVTDGQGAKLARHADHAWHVDGRSYLRLDCDDATTVQFERAGARSEVYGPFTHFSSTDGICYADHEVFAHYDEDTRSWFCHRDREYWPALVVRSVK